MSARLEKFKTVSRLNVDPALAEHWDFDVRSNGDQHIKQQIAQAKRTSTTLKKSLLQFSKIRPEHELAIKAAANAMDALSAELASFVPWAKAYKSFCDAEYKRERQEELESIAQARWGEDAASIQFEVDLINEMNTEDGRLAFAQWLHSVGQHRDVNLKNVRPCVNRIEDGSTMRERMAATVENNRRSTDNKWGAHDDLRVICSWRTHESYLAHRKDIAAKTEGLLKGFAT
jgi:hypothetical protein